MASPLPSLLYSLSSLSGRHTDKKENKMFHIYREIKSGAVAKSYMRKSFIINEQIRKYFPIYDFATAPF
jgi:hypothetical protein